MKMGSRDTTPEISPLRGEQSDGFAREGGGLTEDPEELINHENLDQEEGEISDDHLSTVR